MKSLVPHLVEYVQAMFNDVAYAYRHHSDWERDRSRLIHELGANGERVLTLDLPALDKHFCKCLDVGLYTASALPYGALKSGTQVPEFLQDLMLQVFDVEGKLREHPSHSAIVVIRQILSSAKKLPLQCSQRRVDDEIYDFFVVEQGIRKPTLNWVGDDLFEDYSKRVSNGGRVTIFDGLFPATADFLELPLGARDVKSEPHWGSLRLVELVFDRVAAQFGDLSSERSTELPKHGPGVVSDLRKEEDKYSFKQWPNKLQAQFPYDYYGSPNLGESSRDTGEIKSGHESPSRLIAVPKTLKGPRLIAAEPSQHQWIQQLIWNQLETRLPETVLRHCIDFRSQVPNQRMAALGSVNGEFVTIDLSSASDRLSCWLVERAFRANRTALLRFHACRTRWISNRITPSLWDNLILKKYAPMGSAVTFPLQSIIYASIAIAAVLHSEGRTDCRRIEAAARQVRVFGDDIIVPKRAWRCLSDLLAFCGLKVNPDKSFVNGLFRESCGTDYFAGVEVTPTYIRCLPTDARPGTLASIIEVSNNFHMAGYWHIAALLAKYAKEYSRFIPIVHPHSGTLGFRSFTGRSVDHLSSRWNARLHRDEVRVVKVTTVTRTYDSPGWNRLLQWFIESPDPDVFWESGRRFAKASYVKPGWSALELV